MSGRKKVIFRDGPKKGDAITLEDPPPRWIKLAMPEWAVYEYVDGEYIVRFEGLTARVWRNPTRSPFIR